MFGPRGSKNRGLAHSWREEGVYVRGKYCQDGSRRGRPTIEKSPRFLRRIESREALDVWEAGNSMCAPHENITPVSSRSQQGASELCLPNRACGAREYT